MKSRIYILLFISGILLGDNVTTSDIHKDFTWKYVGILSNYGNILNNIDSADLDNMEGELNFLFNEYEKILLKSIGLIAKWEEKETKILGPDIDGFRNALEYGGLNPKTVYEYKAVKKQFVFAEEIITEDSSYREIRPRYGWQRAPNCELVVNSTGTPNWNKVIDYFGGYSGLSKSGYTKKDLDKFIINYIIESIEIRENNKCTALFNSVGDDQAFQFYNIEKTNKEIEGTYEFVNLLPLSFYQPYYRDEYTGKIKDENWKSKEKKISKIPRVMGIYAEIFGQDSSRCSDYKGKNYSAHFTLNEPWVKFNLMNPITDDSLSIVVEVRELMGSFYQTYQRQYRDVVIDIIDGYVSDDFYKKHLEDMYDEDVEKIEMMEGLVWKHNKLNYFDLSLVPFNVSDSIIYLNLKSHVPFGKTKRDAIKIASYGAIIAVTRHLKMDDFTNIVDSIEQLYEKTFNYLWSLDQKALEYLILDVLNNNKKIKRGKIGAEVYERLIEILIENGMIDKNNILDESLFSSEKFEGHSYYSFNGHSNRTDLKILFDYVANNEFIKNHSQLTTISERDIIEFSNSFIIRPFETITYMRYDLPEDGLVNYTIYDMMGRVVFSLDGIQQNAGEDVFTWPATNNQRQRVSLGLYLCTIQAGDYTQTKKMVLPTSLSANEQIGNVLNNLVSKSLISKKRKSYRIIKK